MHAYPPNAWRLPGRLGGTDARLMHASVVSFDDDTPPIAKILQTFPDEVRPIVEWSLEQWDSLTLTSIFRFAVHDRQDYLISMLAEVGNARSVDLLRSYIDDPTLGRSAIPGDQATDRQAGTSI